MEALLPSPQLSAFSIEEQDPGPYDSEVLSQYTPNTPNTPKEDAFPLMWPVANRRNIDALQPLEALALS